MRLFDDLKSAKSIYVKGLMFLTLAIIAGALLLVRVPRIDIAILLMVCVWAACRAYYFAFYVIEHYVDTDFRYSGLTDFLRYLVSTRRKP